MKLERMRRFTVFSLLLSVSRGCREEGWIDGRSVGLGCFYTVPVGLNLSGAEELCTDLGSELVTRLTQIQLQFVQTVHVNNLLNQNNIEFPPENLSALPGSMEPSPEPLDYYLEHLELSLENMKPSPENLELSPENMEPSPQHLEPSSENMEPSPEHLEPFSGNIEPSPEHLEPSSEIMEPSPQYPKPSPGNPELLCRRLANTYNFSIKKCRCFPNMKIYLK